jgi:hypothetical protein
MLENQRECGWLKFPSPKIFSAKIASAKILSQKLKLYDTHPLTHITGISTMHRLTLRQPHTLVQLTLEKQP